MEFICTAESMAAIVRADSDMAMAKAAGRALRTLATLAWKIDSAKQAGDEIVMPEWEEKDDRSLADAYAELARAKSWFTVPSYRNLGTRENVERACNRMLGALECFDHGVRVGTALMATSFTSHPVDDAQKGRLSAVLATMAAHPDPLVRAAGVVVGTRLWDFYDCKPRILIARELQQAAADPAPEVRFAVAYLGRRGWPELDDRFLRGLRNDPHAAVRAMAWLGPPFYSDYQPALASVSVGLHDPNPIVRTICLDHIARLLHCDNAKREAFAIYSMGAKRVAALADLFNDDPARLHGAMEAEGADDDPWLKIAAEALLARSAAIRCPRLRANSFEWPEETDEVPANVVQAEREAHSVLARLLRSAKRSHAALASAMMMQAWGQIWSEPAPFAAGAACAESPHLPARLIGIAACGVAEPEANAARLRKALASADELNRLAALWGICMAQPRAAAPELQAPLTTLMRAGRRYESGLAARALGVTLPFDKLLALIQDECRTRPGSPAAIDVLTAISNRRLRSEIHTIGYTSKDDLGYYPPTAHPNQMLLLDVVLESRDAELQSAFLRVSAGSMNENAPLLLTFITEGELGPFCELVQQSSDLFLDSHDVSIPKKGFAREAALKRFAEVLSAREGTLDPQTVAAIDRFVAGNAVLPLTQVRKVLDASAPHVQAWLRPDAPEGEIAAAGGLLRSVLSKVCRKPGDGPPLERCLNWQDLPPAFRDACRRVIALANHPVHGPMASSMLVTCLHTFGDPPQGVEPEMADAMARARAAITEKGTTADQAELLCCEVNIGDEQARARAAADLQERLLVGRLPADCRHRAFNSLSRRQEDLTPEFIAFVFGRIGGVLLPLQERYDMIGLLARRPEVYDRLFVEMGKILDAEPTGHHSRWLLWPVKAELERLTKEKQPLPPWAGGAADFALKLARSPAAERGSFSGEYGEDAAKLLMLASGADAATALESMAQDQTANPYARAAAAQFAMEGNPQTKVLAGLAANYDKLPPEMCEKIAYRAARARDVAGAEAFVLSALKDPQVTQRGSIASSLRLPPAPTLIAGLKELENDPLIGGHVTQALKRLQEQK